MGPAPGRPDTPTSAAPAPAAGARRDVAVLLLCAALLLTANIGAITLPSLDDCFYARKGLEMERRGAFFTVTWNGVPSFTYPPLQFWLLGLSFRVFGANDAAARLPSVVMALAIAWLTWRVGRRLAGPAAGATAVALLILSPYFLNNARRCMTEIPLAFWVAATMALLIAGLSRPRLHALLALPLGAAVLTKSVLGLLPIPVIALSAPFAAGVRAALRRPWIWIGTATGLAIGASWTIHQWFVHGPAAPHEHYVAGMFAISTRPLPPAQRILGYPLILLRDLQPVVLPALAGVWLAWRNRTRRSGEARGPGSATPAAPDHATLVVVLVWALGPLVLYNLSSTQSARYLFPTLPALAILGGWWAAERLPRAALILRRFAAPAILAAAAVVYWIAPGTLTRDANRPFRDGRDVIASRIVEGEPLTFLGDDYWRHANPLLWYADRWLEPAPDADAAGAVARARSRASGLLLVTRDWLDDVRVLAPDADVVLEGDGWTLVDVGGTKHPMP